MDPLFKWIGSILYTQFMAGEPQSFYIIMLLHAGVSQSMSRYTMVPSLLEALYTFTRYLLQLYHHWKYQSQQVGGADNTDAQGLHQARLDKGASFLLDEPPGLGSFAFVHNSKAK